MRASTRTAKELREQLAFNRNMIAKMMSDLLSLRKLVADARVAAGSDDSRSRPSLGRPTAEVVRRLGRLPELAPRQKSASLRPR